MVLKMGKGKSSETARVRKNNNKAEEIREDRDEEKRKEDEYWKEAEGAKSRSAKKREEEAANQAKAAVKKAELRQLVKQEEMDMSQLCTPASSRVSKVKQADLIRRKEEERASLKLRAEEEKKKHALIGDELVFEPNTNHDDSVIQASTVDDAIAKLTSSHTLRADLHPEKRIKASFKAFEKEELLRLKEEKPGLTLNQYKDMVLKLWHREFPKLF